MQPGPTPLALRTGDAGRVPPGRILVIEDDLNLGDVVRRYLERDGFEVEVVANGTDGLEQALVSLPDLVLLDLMLPGLDGIEVCRRLRQVAPIPVIMLTARGSEQDRVLGLELGADDYVAKPFSPRELTARVRAVLRRATGQLDRQESTTLTAGPLKADLIAHEVRLGSDPVTVTAKEFDLLVWFMAHPGRAFTREELLKAVWGYDTGDTATVTVHVQRLRSKIEREPSSRRHLVTVHGVGYRFDR